METAILVALGVLIVLVVILLRRGRPVDVSGQIEASLKGIDEAKGVISDHAVKTMQAINQQSESLHKLVLSCINQRTFA